MATYSQYNGYPTALTYFNIDNKNTATCDHEYNLSTGTYRCKSYARSNQCDGFARYAFEAYIHCDDFTVVNRDPYNYYNEMITTDYIFSSKTEEQFKASLLSWGEGTFLRFGKYKDTDGDGITDTCREQHSAVVGTIIDTGVWLYECNNDWKCGVFYTFYTFEELMSKYHCITYRTSHSFTSDPELYSSTRHTVKCSGCNGFVRPTHTGVLQHFSINSTQHQVKYSCCSGTLYTEDHVYSGSYPECLECGYSPELGYGLHDEVTE